MNTRSRFDDNKKRKCGDVPGSRSTPRDDDAIISAAATCLVGFKAEANLQNLLVEYKQRIRVLERIVDYLTARLPSIGETKEL